ncbi:hypothetical protein HY641_00230 [Candidatus Woesearchaeota archaeon]|nr:hypothetical protein [Candidatus Woesearchaeota archaeon]
MEKNTIVAVVLGVLVLVSLVQAFQLYGLKNSVSGGATVRQVSAAAPLASAPASSGAPALPASLNNLPEMVGGC